MSKTRQELPQLYDATGSIPHNNTIANVEVEGVLTVVPTETSLLSTIKSHLGKPASAHYFAFN